MGNEGLTKALCLLFSVFLLWPFVGVLDRPATILGVPSLLFHVFLGWAALVAALAVVSRGTED